MSVSTRIRHLVGHVQPQLYVQIQDFVLTFTAILWEALPFIVLGAVVAGILEEFLPQKLLTRLMPSRPLPAVIVGGLLGLIFPMCECGIVVVMRRLLRKGLPLSCCVAYMLAGPIVNVVVMLSTYVAFYGHGIGPEMVVYRAGFGFLVAAMTGLVVWRLENRVGIDRLTTPLARPSKVGLEMLEGNGARKPWATRISNVAATALHDFMDITVFLILGSILAAFAKLYISPHTIESISQEMPYLAIPIMMGMAILMCLCSEADAFVAASFTNMAMSSKLAFLVLGPMLDLKLLLMYTRVYRPRLIFTIVLCVIVQVFVYITLFHFLTTIHPAVARW